MRRQSFGLRISKAKRTNRRRVSAAGEAFGLSEGLGASLAKLSAQRRKKRNCEDDTVQNPTSSTKKRING